MQGHYNPSSQNRSVGEYRSKFGVKPMTKIGQSLRAVTAKQIVDAFKAPKKGGRYILDNSQLHTVRVCGRIIAINQTETHTDFKIDDGTAILEARIWSNTTSGYTDLTGAMLNAYYDVVGHVVENEDGRNVLLRSIKARRIVDHNDITVHMLTTIHEHCQIIQPTPKDYSHWDEQESKAKVYIKSKFGLNLDKEVVVSLLSWQTIREKETGATAEFIIKECHLDETSGRMTLQSMLDEGSIYNTIDYNHFKLADNN